MTPPGGAMTETAQSPPPGSAASPADPPDQRAVDAFLATWLKGERQSWPAHWSSSVATTVEARIAFHGIEALLSRRASLVEALPASLACSLRDRLIARLGWEELHRRLLGTLQEAFEARGIVPLVFKGTACAYNVYQDPVDRIRSDTDILIGEDDRAAAVAAFSDTGMVQSTLSFGDRMSNQIGFGFDDVAGWHHIVDLHWQFSNSSVLSALFEYRELIDRSAPLDALHPGIRRPSVTDAILIACLHRLVHLNSPMYFDGVAVFSADRMIWLYDLHLLASAMTAQDWADLIARAREKGLAAITARGLRDTHAVLATPIPPAVLDALTDGLDGRAPELPAAYLDASEVRRAWINAMAHERASDRVRHLGEILFPPRDYMISEFGADGAQWLPWLYAKRFARGLSRRLGEGSGWR